MRISLQSRFQRQPVWLGLILLLTPFTVGTALGQGAPQPNPPLAKGSIKVVISQFKKLEGSARLDQLEVRFPQILAVSLLENPWLDISVSETEQGVRRIPKSSGPSYLIDGTFYQIGDKIRVDVAVRNLADGSILFAVSDVTSEDSLLSSMKVLGYRIADKLRVKSMPGLRKQPINFAVITPFQNKNNTPMDRSAVVSALSGWLPDVLAGLLSQSKLENVVFKLTTEQESARPQSGIDAMISGSYSASGNQITITIAVEESGVPIIHMSVSSTIDRVAAVPETIARQVAEIIRARVSPEGEWRKERISLTSARPDEYLREAEAYTEKTEYPRAILMYRKAIETSPNQTDPHLGLATIYVLQKDYDSAASEYREVLKLDAGSAPAQLGLGFIGLLKDSYPDAIEHFQEALRLLPTDLGRRSFAYVGMGHSYLLQGNTESAIDNYLKALEADPGRPDTYRFLSTAYLAAGKRTEASEKLEEALKRFPDNLNLKVSLASIYKRAAMESFSEGSYDAALKSFGKLLAVGAPDSSIGTETYLEMARTYYNLGKTQDGLQVLTALLEKNPRNPDLLPALSLIYYDYLGDYQKAYEIAQRMFDLNPKSTLARSDLAESCLATGNFERAIELANELLNSPAAMVSDKLSMRLITISSLLFLKKRAEAFSQLGQFVAYYKDLPPDYERAWVYKGTKRFVLEDSRLTKSDKDLILSLIEILESPSETANKNLQKLEASIPKYLK